MQLTVDNVKHVGKNINDDFFDFGGVQRIPNAMTCIREENFHMLKKLYNDIDPEAKPLN